MKKPTKTALCVMMILSSSNLWADNLLGVYNLAKDNDPTFLASDAGRMATNEKVNQSMATLLPQLGASVSYKKFNQTSNSIFTPQGAPGEPNASEFEQTSSDYEVILTQEIYNHGSWLNLQQSEKRALQSNVNHEGAKNDLIIKVAETYFNVLAAIDSVEFSKAETQAVSKELAQTKQRFDVGLIAMTDVHEAQSRHDRAVANQIGAQNALDNAHEALQQITGQYHYDVLGLKTDIPLRNPEPANIKQWVKESESKNISIQASRIGLDIAKKSIDIASSGHYPSLDLTASYSDENSNSDSTGTVFDAGLPAGIITSNSDGDKQNTSIGVKFNIPLFSGGRINSQVKEQQALYQQAAHNLEAEHRRAVSETRSSYLGVIAAVSSVNALKQAVISSQSALEATQAGFEVGTRTIVDVLLQTQQLFSAKRDHARARYDYILNTLRLKKAAGLLTEEDLGKVNQMLR